MVAPRPPVGAGAAASAGSGARRGRGAVSAQLDADGARLRSPSPRALPLRVPGATADATVAPRRGAAGALRPRGGAGAFPPPRPPPCPPPLTATARPPKKRPPRPSTRRAPSAFDIPGVAVGEVAAPRHKDGRFWDRRGAGSPWPRRDRGRRVRPRHDNPACRNTLNLAVYSPDFSEFFERANLPKSELSTVLKNTCLNFSTLFSVVSIGPEKVRYEVAH